MPMNSFIIKDSFSFVQELLNNDINTDNVFMASFDIASLFTNIPVDESIEIISNHLFANCMYFEGFDRSQFTKLLSLSVKNCHFIFNGKLVKPTFTCLFTNFHSFVPLAYKRSLVCCLLHRIFHLCSSYENFNFMPNSKS